MTSDLGADVTATEVGRQRPQPASSEEEVAERGGRRTRAALRSPAAARQAIVLREVLGPPVALRPRGSDVPGLRP